MELCCLGRRLGSSWVDIATSCMLIHQMNRAFRFPLHSIRLSLHSSLRSKLLWSPRVKPCHDRTTAQQGLPRILRTVMMREKTRTRTKPTGTMERRRTLKRRVRKTSNLATTLEGRKCKNRSLRMWYWRFPGIHDTKRSFCYSERGVGARLHGNGLLWL